LKDVVIGWLRMAQFESST